MSSFTDFFGLKEDPFKITPDIEYFFLSQFHQEAIMSLNYLVKSGEGFAVIVGEPGTGKTITLRKFIHDLPDSVEYAYILFPNLSPEEMLKAILEDFGLSDVKDRELSKNKLLSKLRDFLIQKKKENKKVLVIIDEAQNLPVETLEELRILSNLETEKEKLLQIILSGQPELEHKLNSPELRQLKQRITLFVRFRNLNYDEMINYITYRLAKAGNMSLMIDKKAYKLVFNYSKGNIRLINLIMERTLMAAFVDNSFSIKPHHVESAVESLKLIEKKKRKVAPIAAGILIPLLLIGVLGFGYYKYADKLSTKEKSEKNVKKENIFAIVAFPVVNLFSKPEKNAPIVAYLKRGDRLEVVEKKDKWFKVSIKKNGKVIEGWIPDAYIIVNNNTKN